MSAQDCSASQWFSFPYGAIYDVEKEADNHKRVDLVRYRLCDLVGRVKTLSDGSKFLVLMNLHRNKKGGNEENNRRNGCNGFNKRMAHIHTVCPFG